MTFVDCPGEVDAVLRICEAHSGDLERFRARPRISTVVTAASPLQVDGGALDIHIALARHGVPIEVYSMTIAGATSPVTLAGSVTQGVAEFLGIATALQVAAPGARAVFCFGSGVLDMLRTTFALGSLESGLMGAMATEVGHYLGVPTLNPGFSTDAKDAGVQAGYEKAMKAATVCGAVPDMVSGWGLIDSHNTMSLPQSVIDNEMAAMLRRLHQPVEVSEATLAGDAIAAVGPGGSFLGAKDTARRIRAGEHYLPTLSNRLSYEKWAEEGTTPNDVACEQVELLAAHADKAPYLDGAQLDEIAAICHVDDEAMRRARREYGAALTQTKHPNGGPDDAQDRLHRARRPRQAPRRQPAARRLPAHRVRRGRELRRRARPGGRHVRRRRSRRPHGPPTRSSPACRRPRRSPLWSPRRAASSRRSPPAAPGST